MQNTMAASLKAKLKTTVLTLASTLFSTSTIAADAIDLLNHTLPSLSDKSEIHLKEHYAGQVILVVNTASACGFTSQYEGLETLYKKYQSQGFVVLGFPSNDFFQERGSDEDVITFCKKNYGVTFPIFRKSAVKGKNANPFYQDLIKASGKSPKWNFFKYLIGRDGHIIGVYKSSEKPLNSPLEQAIISALKDSSAALNTSELDSSNKPQDMTLTGEN